ncbi:hypothetical protein INP83_11460 [Mucilaginibacter sp. 21P]|uniref:hypothetical protein n=1 Tax=Mucilaginibacter sp. 21P TaxID=2778902 RepID=UPI001C55D02A|nr:hypothetical protein [Mucilaginibacter sp. 21P]QXV63726.1 hypothetical protein INP83_11460 [Mucilaginibacter sp. 21P]
MRKFEIQKRLNQEQYILDGIRPSSKNYQAQRQKVIDLKTEIEFLKIQEQNQAKNNADKKDN